MGPTRAFLQCADTTSISSVAKTMVFVVFAVVVARTPVHSCKAAWEGLQKFPLTHGSTHSAITGQGHQASRQNN